MLLDIPTLIFFALLSLGASTVNGGLGYGYSSMSIPLAILVLASKIVNPAYAIVEAMLNTVMLGLAGKKDIASTSRRVAPLVLALVPGVLIGSFALSYVSNLTNGQYWIRFVVFTTLLPLILLQQAGFRRAFKREKAAAVPIGVGVGTLYSLTTISGPPIALFWNNQGLAKRQFRAALAQIRIAESYLTVASYFFLGLFTPSSLTLFSVVAPPILVGLPLGAIVVKKVKVETFRRICMTFDSTIVGFGLSNTILVIFSQTFGVAYSLWAAVIAVNAFLLYRYFTKHPISGSALAPSVRPAGIPQADGPQPHSGTPPSVAEQAPGLTSAKVGPGELHPDPELLKSKD